MNHDQFTYWLQGFVEMNGGKEPTKAQWQMIKDHLQLCFVKVTKNWTIAGSYGGDLRLVEGGGDGYPRKYLGGWFNGDGVPDKRGGGGAC